MASELTVSRRDVVRGGIGLSAGAAFALLAGRSGFNVAFAQDGTPVSDITGFPEAAYTAKEYAFEGPGSIAAGMTRVTLTNNGTMDHHAMFFKFNEGKSAADLAAAAAQGLPGLFAIGVAVGGPGSIGGGQSVTVIMDLAEGNYAILCLIPDADGVPHAMKGMVLPVTVTAATGAAMAAPATDGTIQLEDFHFTGLPETVPAGQHLWAVTNAGQQLHELVIYKQAEGVTFEQVQAMMAPAATPMPGMDMGTPEGTAVAPAGPPPFVGVSGVAPMFPGMTNILVAKLDAGSYFAICFIPDPATGKAHFELGMIQPFTVS